MELIGSSCNFIASVFQQQEYRTASLIHPKQEICRFRNANWAAEDQRALGNIVYNIETATHNLVFSVLNYLRSLGKPFAKVSSSAFNREGADGTEGRIGSGPDNHARVPPPVATHNGEPFKVSTR